VINKTNRLFNTLKHLQFKQLWFYGVRRGFPSTKIDYKGNPELAAGFDVAGALPVSGVCQDDGSFTFLNVSKRLPLHNFDWCPSDVPRLWRYNLHYFDYLREESIGDDEKHQLLEHWIAHNPQGSQPGWEPFTASLRIVNWVFYLQQNPAAQTPAVLRSLYTQALWLEKNDERHILANHYFENLKALTFAGAFFDGVYADRWLRRGTSDIVEQLAEQTLADGGHYERTPQYHGLMLENYLDLFNLARTNPDRFPTGFTELLRRYSVDGLVFYQTIGFPDKKLPLFNDTAFGISPSLAALDGYYQRLSGEPSCLAEHPAKLFALQESGLFGFRADADMLIIDAGQIGPSYQPGHTHCDMLSYELMMAGQRVVVDTGVCEYEPGAVRQHVRSTRAHNTVSVDGAEQSEVWGEFRVARRAKVLDARIEQTGTSIVFEGAYTGFHQVRGKIQHRRKAVLELAQNETISSLAIVDDVSGAGHHHVESFIHLHPDLAVNDLGGGVIDLHGGNGLQLQLSLEQDVSYYLEESYYCPEFGLKIPNVRVVLQKSATLPCEISYSISKV
jgi:uncharacterized heparinase superfamily protein